MYILEINHAKNILFFMYSLCLIYFILLCFQIFRYTRQTRKDVLVQKMEETSATKQETSQLGPCEVIFSDMSEVRSFKQYLSRQGLAKCRLLHGIKKKETDTETEKNIYYDFMRFGGIIYSTQPPEAENSLYQILPRYYLKYLS